MGLRNAITKLSNVSVGGVTTSYDLDEAPANPQSVQLPCLIPLPELSGDSPGLRVGAFDGSAHGVTYHVTHLLLVAPVAQGQGMAGIRATLVDLIDDYVAALKSDTDLDGALWTHLRFAVEPGVYEWGGRRYAGCAFRHTWVIAA
jgi:hypothetical protein